MATTRRRTFDVLFLIFYRESEAGIDVIRVLLGRRDLRSIFEQA